MVILTQLDPILIRVFSLHRSLRILLIIKWHMSLVDCYIIFCISDSLLNRKPTPNVRLQTFVSICGLTCNKTSLRCAGNMKRVAKIVRTNRCLDFSQGTNKLFAVCSDLLSANSLVNKCVSGWYINCQWDCSHLQGVLLVTGCCFFCMQHLQTCWLSARISKAIQLLASDDWWSPQCLGSPFRAFSHQFWADSRDNMPLLRTWDWVGWLLRHRAWGGWVVSGGQSDMDTKISSSLGSCYLNYMLISCYHMEAVLAIFLRSASFLTTLAQHHCQCCPSSPHFELARDENPDLNSCLPNLNVHSALEIWACLTAYHLFHVSYFQYLSPEKIYVFLFLPQLKAASMRCTSGGSPRLVSFFG